MKRQKIVERDEFTFDERMHIYHKSKGRCCHCGKRIEFGGQATVEHFVPLSKGGTNRDVNMIMTCRTCNKEKDDKIVAPNSWVKFLKQDEQERLEEYFESYVMAFDYIEKHNLLACDEYEIQLFPEAARKIKNEKVLEKVAMKYRFERAFKEEDIQRVISFFVNYLNKYGCLDDEQVAVENIRFWQEFGAIYYIEKAGEIKLVLPILMSDLDGYDCYGLNMYLFSEYATKPMKTLLESISDKIPSVLMNEQHVDKVKVNLSILTNDPLSKMLIGYIGGPDPNQPENSRFTTCLYMVSDRKNADINDAEHTDKFFKTFMPKKEELDAYFKDGAHEHIRWMRGMVYPDMVISELDGAMLSARKLQKKIHRTAQKEVRKIV